MEENMILLLKQLSLALEQRGRDRLKHSELSPSQSFVLDYLFSQQDGAVYAAKLRAKLGLSKSALSSLLKDLQKKGYLEMLLNPEDDREKRLFLTPKAYAIRRELYAALEEQQRQLCRGLSPHQLEICKYGLHKMLENLSANPQGGHQLW